MYKTLIILLISLIYNFAHSQVKAIDSINSLFENYKKLAIEENGDEIVKLIDSQTINLYNSLVFHAKYSDSNTVNNLPFMKKFLTLALRHRTPVDILKKMEGKDAFAYGYKLGMVDLELITKVKLSTFYSLIEMNKKRSANIQIMIDGQKANENFYFNFQDKNWKLNFTETLKFVEKNYKKSQENSGISSNDFIIQLIEKVSDKKVYLTIWQPIIL